MKFARYTFFAAGVYGLLAVVPMYFLEEKTGLDLPPAITHPEYYYGFVGVTLAWQIVFLMIGADPRRYRPIMLPAALIEKFAFVIAAAALYRQNRIPEMMAAAAAIDLIWGILFLVAFWKTSEDV